MHHDDFKFEPVRGLPEALPADEHILWQGQPNALRLAKDAWGMNWIIGYFVVLAVWRVGVSSTQFPLTEAMGHGIPFLIGAVTAALIVYGLAYVQAKSTVYTLTNKRVAMRIGAALTMTLNLPYVCIGNAQLGLRKSGLGTLTFEMIGDTRLSYLMTWPHVRPWYMTKTQPALRSIPNAEQVARIFAEAAETRVNEPKVTRIETHQGAEGAVAAE